MFPFKRKQRSREFTVMGILAALGIAYKIYCALRKVAPTVDKIIEVLHESIEPVASNRDIIQPKQK